MATTQLDSNHRGHTTASMRTDSNAGMARYVWVFAFCHPFLR